MPTKNQFVIEIDGISQLTATKVDGLDSIKHTPSKLMVGNRPNPSHERGNYEVGVINVTHAEGNGVAAGEVHDWFRSFVKGEDTTKRGARVIVMDQDGVTPVSTYEFQNCVPTDFKSDGFDAGSSDPAFFNFAFQPEDSDRL
jgi:phage tail-like protein